MSAFPGNDSRTQQTHYNSQPGDYTSEAGTDDSRSFSPTTATGNNHAKSSGLGSIGKKIQLPWESMFGMLLQFYQTNGHSNVPSVGKSGENTLLAPWAKEQQLYFQKKLQDEDISPEDVQRISKLDSIGFFSWSSSTEMETNVESSDSNIKGDKNGPSGAIIKVPTQVNPHESAAFPQQGRQKSSIQSSPENVAPNSNYYHDNVPPPRGYQFPESEKNPKSTSGENQGKGTGPLKKRMAFRNEKDEYNNTGYDYMEPIAKKQRTNNTNHRENGQHGGQEREITRYGLSQYQSQNDSQYSHGVTQTSQKVDANYYGPQGNDQAGQEEQYHGDINEEHPLLPRLSYEWLLSRTGRKLKSCRHYKKQGFCAHGRGCTFAHVVPPGQTSSHKGKFYEEQVETTKCRDPSGIWWHTAGLIDGNEFHYSARGEGWENFETGIWWYETEDNAVNALYESIHGGMLVKSQQTSHEDHQWYGPQGNDGKTNDDKAYGATEIVQEHKSEHDIMAKKNHDHYNGFRLPELSRDWLFDHSRLAYKRCRNYEAGFCKNAECTFAHVQKSTAAGSLQPNDYDELFLECRCGKDSEGSFWFTAGYIDENDFYYASGGDGTECAMTGLWWYKSGDKARAAVRARVVCDVEN